MVLINCALDRVGLHQSNGSQGQRDSMFEHPALKEIQLQTASAQIENQSRLNLISQRPEYGRTNKPRFLLAADHFQFNAGLSANPLHQGAIVASFARGGSGNCPVGAHVMLVHPLAKSLKGSRGAGNRLRIQKTAGERIVAQPHCCPFAIKDLNIFGRGGPRDHEANRVRPCVNRR